jgi:AsmA protein
MSANLYDGQYNGNVTLDARSNALKLAIDEKITGVQAGPLLNDLSGDAPISGTATASAKLTGAGSNVDQIKATLTGSGNFAFTDGALKGINIGESIRKAKAALKGESLTPSNEPVETDFASLRGSFKATNGLISNQDLALMSPLLRVNGAGNANLPTETIDYALKVSIVETSKGQGGKDLADLKGLTIPVKITGTFQSPKPSVDLASLFEQKAKDEAKQKIKEKLDEKLGDKLGGLLGGSSNDGEATESGSSDKVDPKELLKGFF